MLNSEKESVLGNKAELEERIANDYLQRIHSYEVNIRGLEGDLKKYEEAIPQINALHQE